MRNSARLVRFQTLLGVAPVTRSEMEAPAPSSLDERITATLAAAASPIPFANGAKTGPINTRYLNCLGKMPIKSRVPADPHNGGASGSNAAAARSTLRDAKKDHDLAQHQRQEGAEHVAADSLVGQMIDRPIGLATPGPPLLRAPDPSQSIIVSGVRLGLIDGWSSKSPPSSRR